MTSLNTLSINHTLKKPETILVWPQSLFIDLPEGFIDMGVGSNLPFHNNEIWMRRDLANANTDVFRQAASYTVLRKDCPTAGVLIAVYMRGTGADAKLSGKLSAGYGGHPELIDLGGEGHLIANSAAREVNEEIRLVNSDLDTVHVTSNEVIPVGAIIDNSDHIGSYHIGFLSYINVPPTLTGVDTDPNVEQLYGWVTPDELQVLADKGRLENWSVIALRDALRLIK